MTSGKKVRFDVKKIDRVQYAKYDYFQCEKRSPRYKPHNKVGKTSDELKKDEQWVCSNRLAIVRAKAMAFILSNCEDYVNVDEVHMVIPGLTSRSEWSTTTMVMSMSKCSLRSISNTYGGSLA